jgi:TP901 family phage tail tape measure protein
MAKTITDEKIKLSIEVNGDPAQKELIALEKTTRKLTEETKALTAQKKLLEQQGKKDTAEYKNLTAAINANNKVIAENKAKMKGLQDQIGITGLTLSQLRQKATILRATLSNMIPGTEDFRRYQAELNQVNARIGELTGRAAQARFSLSSLADGFNRYQALAFSVIASLAGIALSVQKIIDINGKLSDAQSDVMKTTGMTKDEVNELTKSFGALKTRTARIELLGLATEAGRLGIEGVANVQAFVEQANKMKVALGDDLSDEAIREVGKLVNVYEVGEATGRDFAGSMDALGSSINEVSASGANQAGFLVDYLKRQAGVARLTKLSAADNIGYAATFDELGQTTEVAATAMNKVWLEMMKKPQEFAKVAGVSVKEFKNIMDKDANAAMLMFLDAVGKNKGAASDLLESLKEIEAGGVRGDQALLTLAGKTDLLRQRQQIANQALIEATSLTDEYNIKNTNLAATYEKIQKTLLGWFSSETIVGGLTDFFNWFAKLIGATEDLDGSVTSFKDKLIVFLKVLSIIIVSYISYNAALKLTLYWTRSVAAAQSLYNLIQTRGAVTTNLLKSSQLLLASAYYLVTGQVTRATAAMRLFNAVSKMNPLGLLLGLLAAATAAFVLFKKKVDETTIAQKTLSDLRATVAKNIDTEKNKLIQLLAIAKDETIEKGRRLEAIKRLNELSPEYLGNLTLETIKTAEAAKAINLYIGALEKKAMKEAFESKRSEYQQKKLDALLDPEKDKITLGSREVELKKVYEAEQKLLQKLNQEQRDLYFKSDLSVEETKKKYDAINAAKKELSDEEILHLKLLAGMSSASKDVYREYKKPISDAVVALKTLKEEEEKFIKENTGLYIQKDDVTITANDPAGESEDAKKKREEAARKAKEAADKRLEELKKSAEERLRIERELEDAILANMSEGYQKEWKLEQTNWKRKVEDLQARMIQEIEIEEALLKSKDQSLSPEARDYWAKQAKHWTDTNKHLKSLIETQEQAHKIRLATIQEKAANKEIGTLQDKYNREKVVRETDFNNRIAELNLTEDQKAQAKKDFQLKELEEEEKHLRNLLESYKTIIGGGEFSGIDLSLLTPEQVEEFKKLAEDVGLKLSEMKDKKDAISGKSTQSNAEALGLGGNVDIFGFTPDNWQQLFNNLSQGKVGIEEMVFAVQALSNMWGQYSQFLAANEAQQLRSYEVQNDRRKATLKRQLDAGLISQNQYSRAVETIDAELDRKKAKIEYDQAKRQKTLAAIQIITNTAGAIMGIWKDVPKFDFGSAAFALSAMVGALGALQLATVMKTPLPTKGYEEGYYPVKREQDGKMFNATMGGRPTSQMVRKPKVFLAGENGENFPEMIIDGRSFARFSPELKNALQRELSGVRGFEQGYYKDGRYEVPASSSGDALLQSVMSLIANNNALIAENTEVMRDIKLNGLRAKVLANDYKSIENLEDGFKNFNELKTKNRR